MLSGREFQWGITSMKKEYRWAIVETIGEKRGWNDADGVKDGGEE